MNNYKIQTKHMNIEKMVLKNLPMYNLPSTKAIYMMITDNIGTHPHNHKLQINTSLNLVMK